MLSKLKKYAFLSLLKKIFQ